MLILELSAVQLPFLGLFSAGSACALALAIHLGGAPAAGVGVTALLLRTAVRGGARSLPLDLVPLLLACLVGRFPLAVPLVYLGSQALMLRQFAPPQERRAWLKLQGVVAEMRVLVALAGLALAFLPPEQPALAVLALALWGTHRAVAYSVFRLHSRQADEALNSLDQLEQDMEKMRRKANLDRRRLKISADNQRLIDEMSQVLTGQPDSTQALDSVLNVAISLGQYASAAIFEGTNPVRGLGPHTQKLESAPLLGLAEQVVEKAAQLRSVQIQRGDAPNRIFSGETGALAVPLGETGVLYVGRPGSELSLEECQALLSLALRAGPLLDAARLRFVENRQLQHTQQQSQALAGQVSGLNRLLVCSQQLFANLEGERLLEACPPALSELVPHQQGQIWLQPERPERTWGQGPPAAEVSGLVARVVQSGVPLLIPRLGDGRSFLGAPFPRQTAQGAVVLLHAQADAYSREHQDLLLIFVQQLGLALSNATYLKKVVETQSQLVQSSKMTAVGQLAAGVAHELNTPLGAISLMLDSLSATLDSPNALKKVERANASTERCREIVQKLMIYTRLSLDTKEPVVLDELVHDTLDFFKTQLELDGISLKLQLEPGLRTLGVIQELQQVLVSLLLNAKESQTQHILVSCGRSPEGNWIQVRDAGIGISEENLRRVFEPFFTDKTIGKNVGLGLSVAREIVQKHGGQLTLQSLQGQGTAATILLP